MSIAVEHVSKRFGTFAALDDVTLDVPSGELVALIGPSGSGKTTLLRIIAGLEAPDAGRILFDEEDATAQHVAVRRVGFVFQHYALFRHMTVSENIAFGLRVRPRRLRQDDASAADRRPRTPHARKNLLRRRRRLPEVDPGTQCRFRLPALCAVPAHDGC